ncbi:MAG: phosphate acyltransferase PlsX [Aggregatilineales bacterium]
MYIAVDAMGTDNHPIADVAGAVLAANEFQIGIILVGDDSRVRQELSKHEGIAHLDIRVVHASETITMNDKPSLVGKSKPMSSLHIGMNLVKSGEAAAFVSAGNTGAAHAIAMLYTLKRIENVKRPALSVIFPIFDRPVTIIDAGANADSKPEWLAQFALMGSIYANKVLDIAQPRVGLLSNGEEEGKGNQLILQAKTMIQQMPLHYVGNVEPVDIMDGKVDVIVADGFIGNILIKTFEASSRYLTKVIRAEITSSAISSVGGLLIKPAMERVRRRMDPSEIGGAPLLGVNGVVIISHGSSDSNAIKNAIRQAIKAADGHLIDTIREGLKQVSFASVDEIETQ